MEWRRVRYTAIAAALTCGVGAILVNIGQPARGAAGAKPAATAPAAADWGKFAGTVQPFFNQNCISCHGANNPEGDVNLIGVEKAGTPEQRAVILGKAFNMLRTGKMPPKTAPQPKAEDRTPVLAWLEGYAKIADAQIARSPGRVTLHRLNRAEYNNTIRDLFLTDMQPANAFPVDDAGYGFDNNGDVLSLSPLLMEKYLAAASVVLDKVLYADPETPPPSKQWEAATLEGTIPKSDPKGTTGRGGNAARAMLNGRVFEYGGEIRVPFDAPGTGHYVLRVRAYGKQRPTVQFMVDGKPEGKPVLITEDIQNTKVYESDPVNITAGKHTLSMAFTNGATKQEYDAAMAKAAAQPATAPAAAAPPAVENNEDGAVQAGAGAGRNRAPAASAPASAPATRGAGRGGRGNANGRGGAAGGAAVVTTVTGKPTLGVVYMEAEGPTEITLDRMSAGYRRVMITYPSATVTKREAAEKIIRNFAAKAFRRPVGDDEFKELMAIWTKYDATGEDFESSMHTALQAILVSPHFIYRYERDPAPTDGGVRTIDEFELASRLSYFLWSSMPDDTLFALAEKGQLRANLDAQVDRMLKDPKSRALVDNFAGQWLKLRLMETASPDAKTFPTFDESLRQAMITETRMFFLDILQNNQSILNFIDADYTFLNERLAKHYGIAGVTGEEFRRVQLADKNRGGLLTQASILMITSYPARTSPVLRGKWVLENLFDESPPPPPPDIPALKEQGQLLGTLRQRMEQHRLNPACATCHEQMDAIGFGLENFNAIGGFRKDDGGATIDPSGKLEGGVTFNGPAELKQVIRARSDDFCKTLTSKLLTYGLGRGLEKYDRYAVDELVNQVKANDYHFSALIHGIVHSDPFQKRAAQ